MSAQWSASFEYTTIDQSIESLAFGFVTFNVSSAKINVIVDLRPK
jgi:hypothetical protein